MLKKIILLIFLVAMFYNCGSEERVHSTIDFTVTNESTENAEIFKKRLDTINPATQDNIPGEANYLSLGIVNAGDTEVFNFPSGYNYGFQAQSSTHNWGIPIVYINFDNDYSWVLENPPDPTPEPGTFIATSPTHDEMFEALNPHLSTVDSRKVIGTLTAHNLHTNGTTYYDTNISILRMERKDENTIIVVNCYNADLEIHKDSSYPAPRSSYLKSGEWIKWDLSF